MRSILQIQIAVQEAAPNITDEELRLCVESLRTLNHFYASSARKLIDAIKEERSMQVLKMLAELESGSFERLFQAEKKPPIEWLGKHNIPGAPEQKKQLDWAKKIAEKATGHKY